MRDVTTTKQVVHLGTAPSHHLVHAWMSHITQVTESCHTRAWVKWHTCIVGTHTYTTCTTAWCYTNETEVVYSGTVHHTTCFICEWVISHTWMTHATHANESDSCHTCQWVMPHTSVTHVTHVSGSCHTCSRVCGTTHCVPSLMRGMCGMCGMTHWETRHAYIHGMNECVMSHKSNRWYI